jgi:hypothetical protein
MNLTKMVGKYFDEFQNKNLKNLSIMFDENIKLKDWDVDILGKTDVLLFNEQLFDSVKDIKINIKNIYVGSNSTAIGEVTVVIDNDITLAVVDIITFNRAGKIESIRAYKG